MILVLVDIVNSQEMMMAEALILVRMEATISEQL